MKRIDRIRSMTTNELAKLIIDHGLTDEFCKSDCPGADTDDLEIPEEACVRCCVRWLDEGDRPAID